MVTALGQALFPAQAAGSLILKEGKPVGSALIGQNFSDPSHFWSRPSATGPQPNNALASSGSNQGPLNPALVDAVKARVQALRDADPGNTNPVPVDLVTASASGLDPHISVAAARYQVQRVAVARKLSVEKVEALVEQAIERPILGLLGEPGVNVLRLNLALEEIKS
jgi:K+-transporting ATPase ATPase C chain